MIKLALKGKEKFLGKAVKQKLLFLEQILEPISLWMVTRNENNQDNEDN